MAASTSNAVALSNNRYHDVFINHRGTDVKKTFASYLYYRLLSHGLRAFLDRQEMQVGENLNSQIREAIATATVQVAIFSPRYVESEWCLNELLLMLESGKPIIPVFYHVKPADLRWTGNQVNPKLSWSRVKDGIYAKALREMEKHQSRYNSNTVNKWRDALSRVAQISGLELEAFNEDEGELLEKLIECLVKKCEKETLNVAKFPSGMDERVKDFETKMLLQKNSGKVQFLGITGLGGVGKTTLAKELFNRKRSNYSKSCFLFDVREKAQPSQLVSLQSKLVEALIQRDPHLNSVDEGIEKLSKYLPSSQILLVIDDVDHVDQVDALLPVKIRDALCPRSLILIISRDQGVLRMSRVNESSIYKLNGLNPQYSRELFCRHAFWQPHPPSGFENFVDQFCRASDGLPLSLKVFGGSLYGNNEVSYWEDQLCKIQQILPSEIEEKLKISYNALDGYQQQIFLDVACFFIDENRDTATRILDGLHCGGFRGFQSLQNKCLVEVNKENLIKMHDHIRNMGRNIARDSGLSLHLSARREEIDDLLLQLSRITEVRGIKMVRSGTRANRLEISWHRVILQIPDTEYGLLEIILGSMQSRNLIWLSWYNCPYPSLPSWIPTENLRVLQVSGRLLETLWEAEWKAPLQLRELHIDAPLSNIPISIGKFKHLEHIYLGRQGNLDILTLPEEFCYLQSLKVLVLMECTKMKSLPDSFGDLTNLQKIDLSQCDNLERLPKSFGNLIRLVHLNLKRCESLTISNETLGNISTLQYIDLSYCKKIEVLPPQVAEQRSLQILNLEGTNLKELPSSIGALSNLEVLQLGSPLLDTLPPSLGDLTSLKELRLEDCEELKCLPASVGLLSQLTTFEVRDCPLTDLPFKRIIGETEPLSNLDPSIERCFPRLYFLSIFNTEISKVSISKAVCSNLQHFSIDHCNDLVEVGTLPNTLIKLELISCSNLKKIGGICGLSKLEELNIRWCREVEELPSIKTLVSLKELKAYQCEKLKAIRGFARLTNLRLLDVMYCSELAALPKVENCISLESLTILDCPELQWDQGKVELLLRLKEYRVDICKAGFTCANQRKALCH